MAHNNVSLNPGAHFAAQDKAQGYDARPEWDHSRTFEWRQTLDPNWKFGQGAANKTDPGHVIPIDPYAEGRSSLSNYRLISSAVLPRPTALISTVSKDGQRTNLAPYSFFQAMAHDPPTFVVGQAIQNSVSKDTLVNMQETGECVINVLNEDILEAGNACAVGTPYGISEWKLSGLTPESCDIVKASRVKEAAFAVECKLVHAYPVTSRVSGQQTAMITILEGVRFWVREEAIDERGEALDTSKSKPIGRLFGTRYARILDGFNIPWPVWDEEKEKAEAGGLVGGKADGQ